ncbi:hypothetical protein J6590_063427, partial [Homalodisca vitripennis]
MLIHIKCYVFFCVDNFDQGFQQNGGSHCSVLLLNNKAQTALHYDSVRGLKERRARALLVIFGLHNVPVSEKYVFQQPEFPECGVHVLVNVRLLLGQLYTKV